MEKRNVIKKIVLTGPECSGKTTLSTAIATRFNLPLVKEYARSFLTQINRPYKYEDLLRIAKKQLESENQKSNSKSKKQLIICDTNLQVIKLWSLIKYGKCDPFILKNQDYDSLYILCSPDFKWEEDPLREDENNRKKIFEIYKEELQKNKQDFIIIDGTNEERINLLSSVIKQLIN